MLTTAADAAKRADQRDRADPLLNRRSVLDALGYASIEDYIGAPQREVVRAGMHTAFDLPVLAVQTDDGYDPPLPVVVDWVIDRTRERHRG